MNRSSKLLILMLLITAASPRTGVAGIIVESWELLCSVNGPGSPKDPNDGVVFGTVQNPFAASHLATLGPSSCSASYDFAWSDDDAHFDVFPAHYLEGLDGFTSSSGRITITPAVKSVISFSGTWTYAWPSAAVGEAGANVGVVDVLADDIVAAAGDFGGNVGLGPPFGTITFADAAVLHANRPYLIIYSATVNHIDPTPPGTHGDAFGEIHVAIAPFPEPATLTLVLPAAILASRPRRRFRRSRRIDSEERRN